MNQRQARAYAESPGALRDVRTPADWPAPGAWRKGWLGWLKRLIHKDCDHIHHETLEVLWDQVRYGNDRQLRLTAEVIHKDKEIAHLTTERDALQAEIDQYRTWAAWQPNGSAKPPDEGNRAEGRKGEA